jgi:hypothetical protein
MSWTMSRPMHNIILWTIKITIQKSTFIAMSCDEVTTFDNQS